MGYIRPKAGTEEADSAAVRKSCFVCESKQGKSSCSTDSTSVVSSQELGWVCCRADMHSCMPGTESSESLAVVSCLLLTPGRYDTVATRVGDRLAQMFVRMG